MGKIQYIIGDVRTQSFKGIRVIPHVCNDLGLMGAGVAKALYIEWPQVKEHYTNSNLRLGEVDLVACNNATYVANMIAQHGIMESVDSNGNAIGKDGKPPLRYAKLVEAMEGVADFINHKKENGINSVIHCPKFGCDLAGGNWDFVEVLIEEIWCPVSDVKVCIIDKDQFPKRSTSSTS